MSQSSPRIACTRGLIRKSAMGENRARSDAALPSPKKHSKPGLAPNPWPKTKGWPRIEWEQLCLEVLQTYRIPREKCGATPLQINMEPRKLPIVEGHSSWWSPLNFWVVNLQGSKYLPSAYSFLAYPHSGNNVELRRPLHAS